VEQVQEGERADRDRRLRVEVQPARDVGEEVRAVAHAWTLGSMKMCRLRSTPISARACSNAAAVTPGRRPFRARGGSRCRQRRRAAPAAGGQTNRADQPRLESTDAVHKTRDRLARYAEGIEACLTAEGGRRLAAAGAVGKCAEGSKSMATRTVVLDVDGVTRVQPPGRCARTRGRSRSPSRRPVHPHKAARRERVRPEVVTPERSRCATANSRQCALLHTGRR